MKNDDYEIGIQSIDDHHHEVFQLTTMLDRAVRGNKRDDLEPILDFLERDLLDHFQEEEEVMRGVNYEGYLEHHTQHQVFEARIHELRRVFNTSPHGAHVVYGIRRFVDALIIHILTIDVKMRGLQS
ncbi:MAG: hemerythrin domain-containing protein [bacterium]|nr:hemerythrin domain-containing protein [bacterium]